MLWEIEVTPLASDLELARMEAEYAGLGYPMAPDGRLLLGTARGFLLEGDVPLEQATQLMNELLVDPLVEGGVCNPVPPGGGSPRTVEWTVLLKPGVMDPVAQSVVSAARDLGISLSSVRTFRRYILPEEGLPSPIRAGLRRVLANDAIEQIVEGCLSLDHLGVGSPFVFRLIHVPLRDANDAALMRISRDGQLALTLPEMQAIQAHFRELGRDPTDVELETLAQTWSEHCSHKTLKGPIDVFGENGNAPPRRINHLLKETIFGATQEIRRGLGPDDWCVSVFEDNAGVVRFDDKYNVCFKVETHNHPSAIEPYGGANTGIGGVIRDPLGTGLGAKPVCNTDVFCFAPPTTPSDALPPGVLHPKKLVQGVVAGVRDYGNRMGIPTVNGAVCFDDQYLANPLVYCGTVGVIPVDRCHKEPQPGDLVVVLGGRTGRDGIHGATFSSLELTAESEAVSGGAVQIGNAIAEKKLLDVLLQARDRNLYHAITDCGAGGFSSAVGEMAAGLGALVHLDRAPLKYEGLSYTEIWISESQERMILAVPPGNWRILQLLCASEDVEATVLGHFEPTGRLRLMYLDQQVGDLDMHFLHEGRPEVVRKAVVGTSNRACPTGGDKRDCLSLRNQTDSLLRILSSWNVCSKEWVVRQYDHEVQGGTVIKPLVGVHDDGPGDAAVIVPGLGSWVGLAVGCGINPRYGALSPYWMAASAVDEAVRNVVAVGADPERVALLDNFCWGNTEQPEVLGDLVQAAEACRDAALAYRMPFISGKDSLNNEYHSGDNHIRIPPTLLISALGRVPDVRRCVTMDLKEAGNLLFLVGVTKNEMGGSHFHLIHGLTGGAPPRVDFVLAPRVFRALHQAIRQGLVRSCHDLSEGGLAVAVAEMAFAGEVGADLTRLPGEGDDVARLFAESNTRFVIEVKPENVAAVRQCFGGELPLEEIGHTRPEPYLRLAGSSGAWLIEAALADLIVAWQKPLRW